MRISDWSSDVCSSDLKTESGIRLRARQNGQTVALDAERVLIATGRTPNIEGLGLEEAGIAVDGSRGIAVDDRLRTTRANTYAARDVTGRDQFVYMAAYGAKIAARNALNGDHLVRSEEHTSELQSLMRISY